MATYTIKPELVDGPTLASAKNCNAIEFVNLGDGIAKIDGRPIPPYATGMQEYPSICYAGLNNEVDKSEYQITFATGATVTQVLIVRKFLK